MRGLGAEEDENLEDEWTLEEWEETYENDSFYDAWPAEGVG